MRKIGERRTGPLMGGRRQIRLVSRIVTAALLALLVMYVFVLMPMPYYILKPGGADEIRPMVHVKLGEGYPEQGSFLLTTVSVVDANLSAYIWAQLRGQEMQRKQQMHPDESDKEYEQRQQYIMVGSQTNAMQAAYKKLGVAYHIANHGVMVLSTSEGMPAASVLKPGDLIVKADDVEITNHDELVSYLQGRKEGDTVRISYKRDNATRTTSIALARLPEPNQDRVGLGVGTGDVQSIETDDKTKEVTVDAGDIGGPSAGLMFSLEIYNQLTPEDITKGYRIAGTGEITPDGKVGMIGGIQHKVAAADREGAEIFFSPQDVVQQDGTKAGNSTDAEKAAAKIGTKMKIVPVATMDDALNYLASLPPKTKPSGSR